MDDVADDASNDTAAEPAGSEHDRIEQLKRRCLDQLARIREQAEAGEATDVGSATTALLTALNDPVLDHAFTAAIRTEIKTLELTANMKATDMAVRRAVGHAQGDRKLERNQEVGLARNFLARAVALGANEKFKRIAEMSIESAMLTGGVKQAGPTRAKPKEEAPPPPSLAKEERREFKRYDHPIIKVAAGDKSFSVQDWSLGGMLVLGSTADEFPHGEPVQVTLSARGSPSTGATVVQVRVEIRRGGLGVRFEELTPELAAFLRALITQRGRA
jgi:hypothetical protein